MKSSKIGLLLLAAMVLTPVLQADWTDIFRPFGPRQKINTLIITANYRNPLLLAELVQTQNRQPYILVPATQDIEQDIVYFCPSHPKAPALQVRKADFARFVQFVNPQQVIILGDTTYVPQEYVDAIDARIARVVISGDWQRAASTLGQSLNLTNLDGDYRKLVAKLDEREPIYKPEAAGAKPDLPQPPEVKDPTRQVDSTVAVGAEEEQKPAEAETVLQ